MNVVRLIGGIRHRSLLPFWEKVHFAFVRNADEGKLDVMNAASPSPLSACCQTSPLPEQERGTTSGFSLVESLVVVSMIGILTAMSLQAIPALRAHQELVTDTETIRALLLDAKQRALNQVRPDDCLPGFSVEDSARAGCSDVGVALRQGEIIEFANSHEASGSGPRYDTNDYIIMRSKAASKIKFGSPTSLLFLGNPPITVLYKDGAEVAAGDDSTKIILTASNGRERTITVYSSGTIDVK